MNWRETVAQCLQSESLTAWEVEFLRGIENSGPEYQLSQRGDHKHLARVYIAQSRATQHRQWKITLLNWACERTRQAMQKEPRQLELI